MKKSKIIGYDIVSTTTLDDLADKVKVKISDGWQPFGQGVERVNGKICQTIRKYKKIERNEIVDYDFVVSNAFDDLIKKVNGRISDGWQPFGQCAEYSSSKMYQIIVKYKKSESKPDASKDEE